MTANISWSFQAELRQLIEFSDTSKQYDSPKNARVRGFIRLNYSELIY